MSVEQAIVLALLVAAFAAGWIARGSAGRERKGGAAAPDPPAAAPDPPAAPLAPATRPVRRASASRPDPAADAGRALERAAQAYETAVDRWLDERDAVTPAGRAAVGELHRAVERLGVACERLDDAVGDAPSPQADAADDALRALREAAARLDAFREGRPLDAGTSRELARLEADVERARAAFA